MKVVAVVVTYNRLDKLKIALEHYSKQTVSFDTVIVVDNHSTDGTPNFLREWENTQDTFSKKVLTLPDNMGGAGGFAAGQEYAIKIQADWVHLADDDAYPENNIVEKFKMYLNNSTNDISAICGTVHNMDGNIDVGHRRRINFAHSTFNIHSVGEDEYKKSFEVNMFSYVGTFLNVSKLVDVGICNREMFIYCDDMEHSYRLSRIGRIVVLPTMKIYHDNAGILEQKNNTIVDSWRTYYLTRNLFYFVKKNDAYAAIKEMSIYMRRIIRDKDHKGWVWRKMMLTALWNGLWGKLGKHALYKPGYVIERNT